MDKVSHTNNQDIMIAAVLHDIIEDKDNWNIARLRKLKFSERALELIDLLTKQDNEEYMTYIKRLATDTDATLLKKADLEHNSKITRLIGLTKDDFDRMEKYHTAYTYLNS